MGSFPGMPRSRSTTDPSQESRQEPPSNPDQPPRVPEEARVLITGTSPNELEATTSTRFTYGADEDGYPPPPQVPLLTRLPHAFTGPILPGQPPNSTRYVRQTATKP